MSAETEITPQRAAELLDEGAQALDVREDYEWDAGHLAGAKHVELTQLSSAAAEIDQARPVVVYCRVGERSGLAAEALRAAGFDAYNLAGGLAAWSADGRPLEPETGTVVERRPGAVT